MGEDRRSVLVVGGGLAGITAALALADRGDRVILAEARPRLGGEAFSFTRGELTIDNGQHVFLRCCTAYRGLLDRMGVGDRVFLQDRLDVPVLRPDRAPSRLRRSGRAPAPLHLAGALARYRVLTPAQRARAVRGGLALRRLDPADPALDGQSLGQFLRAHGQTGGIIDALWGMIATATLNCDPEEASLQVAAKVFRTGLLDDAAAGDIGYAAAPLGNLHDTAARRALAGAGVDVRLTTRIGDVEAAGSSVVARLRQRNGEEEVTVDDAVLAVPPRSALAAAPALGDDPVGRAVALTTSPIVNIHVIYDRRVSDLPFAAAVDSPVQWVFDRTESSGLTARNPEAQYLAVTVSAADGVIDEPARELLERYQDALARLFPAARTASVLDAFVTRERNATFRQRVGANRLRPAARTGIAGLHVAGAWTATGWPDTMEGAVRSGLAAASSVQSRRRRHAVEAA